MDRTGNIWYTYDFNRVGRIALDGTETSFSVGTTASPSGYDSYGIFGQLVYNSLEGIASDMSDRVWVVNSYENTIYVLSGDEFVNTIPLSSNNNEWYLDTGLGVQVLTSDSAKSLQAYGDWSGMRYLQKYFYI